jgi:hypothetical protein
VLWDFLGLNPEQDLEQPVLDLPLQDIRDDGLQKKDKAMCRFFTALISARQSVRHMHPTSPKSDDQLGKTHNPQFTII